MNLIGQVLQIQEPTSAIVLVNEPHVDHGLLLLECFHAMMAMHRLSSHMPMASYQKLEGCMASTCQTGNHVHVDKFKL